MGTKRTPEQVLGEGGEKRFDSEMPAEWLVRKVTKDYAIDFEVEIVVDERVTGLSFKVQVKSTSRNESQPTASIDLTDLRYWRTLDVPVLLVLYVHPTDTLYARWIFTVDDSAIKPGQEKLSVSFSNRDELRSVTQTVPEVVSSVRALRSGLVEYPMHLRIGTNLTNLSEAHYYRAFSKFLQASSVGKRIVKIGGIEVHESYTIEILSDCLWSVRLPFNQASITLRDHDFLESIDSWPPAVLLALAAIHSSQNRFVVALDLIRATGFTTSLWGNSAVVSSLAACLEATNRKDIVLDVCEGIVDNAPHDACSVVAGYLLPWYSRFESFGEGEFSRVVRCWERLSDYYYDTDRKSLVVCTFNLANAYWSFGDYRAARETLDRAVELGPTLAELPEIMVLRGAFAFRADDFVASALYYGKAFELAPSDTTAGHLVDALMCSGYFSSALEVSERETSNGRFSDLLAADLFCLRAIVRDLGVVEQLRAVTDEIPRDAVRARQILAERDALHAPSWAILPVPDSVEEAVNREVLLARLVLSDSGLWVNALVCAWSAYGPEPLVDALVEFAVRQCGFDLRASIESADFDWSGFSALLERIDAALVANPLFEDRVVPIVHLGEVWAPEQ